jgi:hypothetical protein
MLLSEKHRTKNSGYQAASSDSVWPSLFLGKAHAWQIEKQVKTSFTFLGNPLLFKRV